MMTDFLNFGVDYGMKEDTLVIFFLSMDQNGVLLVSVVFFLERTTLANLSFYELLILLACV